MGQQSHWRSTAPSRPLQQHRHTRACRGYLDESSMAADWERREIVSLPSEPLAALRPPTLQPRRPGLLVRRVRRNRPIMHKLPSRHLSHPLAQRGRSVLLVLLLVVMPVHHPRPLRRDLRAEQQHTRRQVDEEQQARSPPPASRTPRHSWRSYAGRRRIRASRPRTAAPRPSAPATTSRTRVVTLGTTL